MSGYIGTTPVPQASQTRDVYTATAGQTSFATSGYSIGFLDVYVNGSHLKNGTDYTASNGSDVVMASGLTVGDYVEVVAFTTFETGTTSGGGYYKGERGTIGPASGAGDIFRINEQTLNTNVTIDADENATAAGPLAVASGVTLTVTSGGNLSIV